MKRLIMFAALALLLAGCANETSKPVESSEVEPVVASETVEEEVSDPEPVEEVEEPIEVPAEESEEETVEEPEQSPEDFEAEVNTVSGITQILMNRGLMREELDKRTASVREQPYIGEDGTYGRVSPSLIELQALRDSLMGGTELALMYPQSEAITSELQSAREAMGQWDASVAHYNELVYTYSEAVDADEMMAKWEELNAALDAVYATLDFPTAALESF